MVNKTMKQMQDSDDLWSPHGASDNPLLDTNKEKRKEQAQARKDKDNVSHEIKPLPELTKKQKAFTEYLREHPKSSASEAARAAYNIGNRAKTSSIAHVSRQIARENMHKPAVLAELSKYSVTAESVITEVLEQSRKRMYGEDKDAVAWATNARQTADSLLDRLHGKATQRTEVEQRSVSLTIDLTSVNR